MTKDYKSWMPVKAEINNLAVRPNFKERDVFWASIGENVGYEQDGKSRAFSRPVLVIKKFNKAMFWGLPLSTTSKQGVYYYPTNVSGKAGAAILSQLRVFDSSRLIKKMGMISASDFTEIRGRIAKLLA